MEPYTDIRGSNEEYEDNNVDLSHVLPGVSEVAEHTGFASLAVVA